MVMNITYYHRIYTPPGIGLGRKDVRFGCELDQDTDRAGQVGQVKVRLAAFWAYNMLFLGFLAYLGCSGLSIGQGQMCTWVSSLNRGTYHQLALILRRGDRKQNIDK